MLTQIQLIADTTTINVSVLDYDFGSFVLKAADGLDPPAVDVFVRSRVTNGGVYKGRRVPKREIVLRIGVSPDYTSSDPVGALRDQFYALLAASTNGLMEVRLIDSVRPTLTIKGVIEKFEWPTSNADIEVQLTIVCPDPFLTTLADVVSAPALSTYNVTYEGNVAVGFTFTMSPMVNQVNNWVQITKSQTGERMKMYGTTGTTHSYITDTRDGTKAITRSIAGVFTNALFVLDTGDTWLKLTPGLNTFVITALAGTPGISAFAYRPTYWGL